MGTVNGSRGGFIVTRGKPRYAQLEGRHFVVGRNKAHECASIESAYSYRDELLKSELSAHADKREVAAKAPAEDVPGWLTIGASVRCDMGEGNVLEIGRRSVLVAVGRDFYRRAAKDLVPA